MSVTMLDVRGLSCPLPVLRAKRALKDVPIDSVLRVQATDPAALKDMPVFCEQTGHELVAVTTEENDVYVFDIRKTA